MRRLTPLLAVLALFTACKDDPPPKPPVEKVEEAPEEDAEPTGPATIKLLHGLLGARALHVQIEGLVEAEPVEEPPKKDAAAKKKDDKGQARKDGPKKGEEKAEAAPLPTVEPLASPMPSVQVEPGRRKVEIFRGDDPKQRVVVASGSFELMPEVPYILLIVGKDKPGKGEQGPVLRLLRDDRGESSETGATARVIHGAVGLDPVDVQVKTREGGQWFVNAGFGKGTARHEIALGQRPVAVHSGLDTGSEPLYVYQGASFTAGQRVVLFLTGQAGEGGRDHPMAVRVISDGG